MGGILNTVIHECYCYEDDGCVIRGPRLLVVTSSYFETLKTCFEDVPRKRTLWLVIMSRA